MQDSEPERISLGAARQDAHALIGRTPLEAFLELPPANEAPRFELRLRWPRKARCAQPPSSDPEGDKHIAERWKDGDYRTYADLARELGKKPKEIKYAVDRYRKKTTREKKRY